jgi:hypothetical protein
MDALAFDDALLPDDPRVTVAELRTRLGPSDDVAHDELGLRRLLEYPEELAPSFLYAMD